MNVGPGGDLRWIFVPYDQLTDEVGPLASEDASDLAICFIENPQKAARRPYHQQKLATILANGRAFCLEQATRGVHVRHVVAGHSYLESLRELTEEVGTVVMMEAAERELRVELQPLVDSGAIEVWPHQGWLTDDEDWDRSVGKNKTWRMDSFYRHVRKRTGWLMDEDGQPEGGKLSYDADNREFWPGAPEAPPLPTFASDPIKEEVLELVATHYAHHPGKLQGEQLPTTAADAEKLWNWALEHCMDFFGPYEDAMSTRSRNLFHTRISPLLNLHRLLPGRVVEDVATSGARLNSREGFIRQVLGWREFVRHVHRRTDGFRRTRAGEDVPVAKVPGDGGHANWLALEGREPPDEPDASDEHTDGGAMPDALGATNPVPAAFWGRRSGLFCLDTVIDGVWDEGYGHHITRLMVLANIGTLLDLSPRELTNWFWVAYADAYDWVVEPNVLGMGTYAVGDLMTTKPYVSGGAYIDKMSDYCSSCAFDVKKNCPVTRMYWAFLARHEDVLGKNVRIAMPMRSLAKRAASKRAVDAKVFETVRDALASGEFLEPADIVPLLSAD